jgi:hypothetical protein
MPYNSAQATKGITILAVTVTLEVSPSPPWTAGQTVTLKATVTKDGTPWAGATVNFYISRPYTKLIGTGTTNSSGVATLSYAIPWTVDTTTVPCTTAEFVAIETSTATTSNRPTGKVAYPTRISITAPDSVPVGYAFDITGKLEYQSASGVWSPLAGKTVSLYYNTTKISDVTTGSDGAYREPYAKIPTPGTYTLKAVYAGEGFTAAATAFLGLTVSPEAKATLSFALPLLTGAIVAYASLKAKR